MIISFLYNFFNSKIKNYIDIVWQDFINSKKKDYIDIAWYSHSLSKKM